MSTRNQRRNRHLAYARQCVAELETIVRQLSADLATRDAGIWFHVERPTEAHRTPYNNGHFLRDLTTHINRQNTTQGTKQ